MRKFKLWRSGNWRAGDKPRRRGKTTKYARKNKNFRAGRPGIEKAPPPEIRRGRLGNQSTSGSYVSYPVPEPFISLPKSLPSPKYAGSFHDSGSSQPESKNSAANPKKSDKIFKRYFFMENMV
ncbi:MAG: hypothetical protein DBY30_05370 [Verrucomicrobia bacterium]|nr:MAG: hypothetical protein DBY30_05370 [Verrucomicrobiota bacterium]